MDRFVEVAPDVRLWIGDRGRRDVSAVLLIMGANASGLAWPDQLVERLGQRHRVIRYDHRDTGRSTWAFDTHPYAITDLAEDAVALLDALDVDRAHVVGMSMGGTLVQLLLHDHPERRWGLGGVTRRTGAVIRVFDQRWAGIPLLEPNV